MNLNYNPDIPAANNNPSDDQPDMLENTNSIRDWVNVDHFGFGQTRGGVHKQTRMIKRTVIPGGLVSSMGTSYVKDGISTGILNEPNLFYTPGSSGDEYQVTRTITASYALFGNLINNYNGVGVRYTAGWTFLPGGLLYQYGTVTHANQTGTLVQFPVAFSTLNIVINLTPVAINNDDHAVNIQDGTISSTQFGVSTTSRTELTAFHWVAVGK